MSATGRSDVRYKDDNYSTPAWATRSIIPYVIPDRPISVLDPCAGTGSILCELKVQCPWVQRFAIEKDPARGAECSLHSSMTHIGDALSSTEWPAVDLVLTNPPYRQAMVFLERALAETGRGGTVCMLLRLNFLGSQKRAAFWQSHPADIYVLSRRPSFAFGGTDATEYMWLVFAPERKERRWQILGP